MSKIIQCILKRSDTSFFFYFYYFFHLIHPVTKYPYSLFLYFISKKMLFKILRNQNLLRNVPPLVKFRGSAVIFHDNSIIFINFVAFRNEFLSRFTNGRFSTNTYSNCNNNINEKIMTHY